MVHTIAGKPVGDIGFGLMGLTFRATPLSEDDAIATMKAALDAGCNYWNGGEFYGPPDRNSLLLLQKYFARYPEDAAKVVINIKGGIRVTTKGLEADGSPAFIRQSIDRSLAQLGPVGRIDEYELARRDTTVPYDESVAVIAEYVAAGKIGGVACSEVSEATLRKAAAVTKITSVEVEISLWETEPLTNGLAAACAELDIPILAYCKGFLTGQIKSPADIPDTDWRKHLPRFSEENFPANLELVDAIRALAARKGCTPAQIAINWVIAQGRKPGMPKIIPIPGASSPSRVQENAKVVDLSDDDVAEIDAILKTFEVTGERYHKDGMALLDRK